MGLKSPEYFLVSSVTVPCKDGQMLAPSLGETDEAGVEDKDDLFVEEELEEDRPGSPRPSRPLRMSRGDGKSLSKAERR